MPADSNRQTLSFVREATFGTTPASGMQIVPFNGGGTFGLSSESTRSQRVRTDAQLSQAKRTGTSPNISIPGELSSDYDQLLRGAIRSNADWTTDAGGATPAAVADVDITVDTTALTATLTAAAATSYANIEAEQWVYLATIEGTVNNGNVGWWKVRSKTPAGTGVVLEDPNGDWTAEADIDILFRGSYLRNGNDVPSYTWQKNYADQTNLYEVIRGARPNGFGLSMALGGIVECNFDYIGSSFEQAAAAVGGTAAAAPNGEIFGEVDNFDGVWIDNQPIDWDLIDFSMTGQTQARAQRKAGDINPVGVAMASLGVTGSLSAYLDADSWPFFGRYLNGEKFSLAVAFANDSNRYLIELFGALLSNEAGDTPGEDTDKTYQFDFEAEPGGDVGKTIQIVRV